MINLYPKAVALTQRYKPGYFSLTDKPISTFAAIKQSSRLIVSTTFSDLTIYPNPAINWLFRAHHDRIHLASGLGFTLEEEIEVTKRGIIALGLQTCPLLADLYWLDNVGMQLEYYRTGSFPTNQLAFIAKAL